MWVWVWVSVCANMRVRVLAYGCMHAWVRACAYTFVCAEVRTCMRVRVRQHTRTCVHICVRVRVPLCDCVSLHTGMRARMCAYVSACGVYVPNMCVCVCVPLLFLHHLRPGNLQWGWLACPKGSPAHTPLLVLLYLLLSPLLSNLAGCC